MAAAMGIALLTEEQYRQLQMLGSSISRHRAGGHTAGCQALGGALFCDRRYGRGSLYHNGAPSYYASRGFRGALRVTVRTFTRPPAARTPPAGFAQQRRRAGTAPAGAAGRSLTDPYRADSAAVQRILAQSQPSRTAQRMSAVQGRSQGRGLEGRSLTDLTGADKNVDDQEIWGRSCSRPTRLGGAAGYSGCLRSGADRNWRSGGLGAAWRVGL